MNPTALGQQLEHGIRDFLRYSFWSSTPGMEHVVEDLVSTPDALVKGPYVSLKLPFVRGSSPDFFPDVPLGFTPHAHQERAFERLGGLQRKRSTLVATGTGSGKTESFLLPILDHCLRESGSPGVKAILIYPMNALATDQALRIAKLVHRNERLQGSVRAGLYIGERPGTSGGTKRAMGPTTVITDRESMKLDPPDILLTNYKMLDYLLLRPGDQGVWRHNHRGTLKFLVVDEIHTFDGAQGTDLACLVRRLKRRLQVDDGSLCCVGTSATLGGPAASDALRAYAEQVFGEHFDAEAVVGEQRLSEADFLAGIELSETLEPGPEDVHRLDPAAATDPAAWLCEQVTLWFGSDLDADPTDSPTWAVQLGERIKGHATFRALLTTLRGRTLDADHIISDLARRRPEWLDHPDLAQLSVNSLLALVAHARAWRDELPEQRARRETEGRPRPVERFVDLRLQLWQRELRRMVASVEARPRLRHSDDLDQDARRLHLPLTHCRDCGAMGWTARIDRDKPHLLRSELTTLYRDFFASDPRIHFLYPRDAIRLDDPGWRHAVPIRVDTETLATLGPEDTPVGEAVELVRVHNVRSTEKREELTRDCPFCGAHESLALVGFRAASLTSVYIDQLFASTYNEDKKLLTFSDSVQDAAHRAGFFGARTWRTNLRIAMLDVIRQQPGLSVADLGRRLGGDWRGHMPVDTWVSTFLAPNMVWLHDWGTLQESGALPDDSDLVDLIDQRLAYEVQNEFGLQAGIGRSLSRTGAVAVALDPARIDRAVAALLEPMQNEVPGLRDLDEPTLRRFVVGFLHHLRRRGGILSDSLPATFINTGGGSFYGFKQAPHLPAFGRNSRLPTLLVDRSVGRGRFDTFGGRDGRGWYARWTVRCLGRGAALTTDAASVASVLLPGLVRAGLLRQTEGKRGELIRGLDEGALLLLTDGQHVRCTRCGTSRFVAPGELPVWDGMPCVTAACDGQLTPSEAPPRDYFARLYATGDLQRIFTAEHTGLLDRQTREEVETQFKADGPDARKPWYPNLLSCTPTLEMGIDIGDLSTAVLCSVPPRQSSYLQRIGRAGRRDGNSLVLTVANARPHDNYFFAAPEEMMEGDVEPPGVFLDAAAVLERQLTAFCFDRWVHEQGEAAVVPHLLREVLGQLEDQGAKRFPFNLFAFVQANGPTLLREFGEMFAGHIGPETLAHLDAYLHGTGEGQAGLTWNILEALTREQRHRDSLSNKARALREEMKRLREMEAKPEDWEELYEQLESEKDALLALVKGINNSMVLEFLTDEGLLPNYAFPESAVRLSSVIWRKKKKVPKEGSKFDTWTYEYARSPASAISELAPQADFYAGGRRVKIDQVDVTVSEVETWRFCDACSHAQRIDTGDENTTCPSCSSAMWRDEGQRSRMLRLQQVFANAPDRESRIKDDQDDRRPRFFQRQILVDVREQDLGGAWVIGDNALPFGFEFLSRATFREVNFGDLTDQGPTSLVAGREAVRAGFQVCARCGKVQDPNKDEPIHAFSCPSRRTGRTVIEECLYLYREFASEALRILLPTADLSSSQQLNSFVAALQLGLQQRFGGSVDHIRTTVYSEPVPDSALRKQYLVLFDSVPGGTGYLKQVVKPQTADADMPLFEAMTLAVERIEGCDCWNDPDRDGCYRCLFAYRNARDQQDTSAQAASRLLRDILDRRHQLEAVRSLSDVSITGLMDSVLEVRFVEALRHIERDGETARLKPVQVNQKPGYLWSLGDAEWFVEPQVDRTLGSGAGIKVSIDFVLRQAGAGGTRKPIAVFLDGWEFHRERIDHDLRQRMALLATGQWDVWSFTWSDLDEVLTKRTATERLDAVVASPDDLRRTMTKALAAEREMLTAPVFRWFIEDLVREVPWAAIGRAALASRMGHADPAAAQAWRDVYAKAAPALARAELAAMQPRLTGLDDRVPMLTWMACHDGVNLAFVAVLDDHQENLEHPDLRAAWQAYLRMFQLLRHVDGAWFMTRRGMAGGDYGPIGRLRAGQQDAQATWAELDEVQEAFLPLAERLMAAGVPEPAVGMEIPDSRGDTWAEAELLWEDHRVAVTSREQAVEARGEPHPDWMVLFVDDIGDDPAPVRTALAGRGGS